MKIAHLGFHPTCLRGFREINFCMPTTIKWYNPCQKKMLISVITKGTRMTPKRHFDGLCTGGRASNTVIPKKRELFIARLPRCALSCQEIVSALLAKLSGWKH